MKTSSKYYQTQEVHEANFNLHLLPLAKPSIQDLHSLSFLQLLAILPRGHRTSTYHRLSLTQVPQSTARPSLLRKRAVKDDEIFVSESANEFGHPVVMLVDRDILRADYVAADIVVISDVDDCQTRFLSFDEGSQVRARDEFEVGVCEGRHVRMQYASIGNI